MPWAAGWRKGSDRLLLLRYLHVNPEEHAVVLSAPLAGLTEYSQSAAEVRYPCIAVAD